MYMKNQSKKKLVMSPQPEMKKVTRESLSPNDDGEQVAFHDPNEDKVITKVISYAKLNKMPIKVDKKNINFQRPALPKDVFTTKGYNTQVFSKDTFSRDTFSKDTLVKDIFTKDRPSKEPQSKDL